MANEINNNDQVQQAVNQALVAEKQKKKKKRLIILGVIAGIIVLLIIISSLGKSGDSSDKTGADSTAKTSSSIAADNKNKQEGQLGDYVCTVKSATICNDWSGKKAVLITYEFTNNSKEAKSFDIALSDEAYQNGIGLETSFIDGNADEIGLDVKIKPGTSKDVSKVYILRDETTPIDIEITEFISLSDDKLTYTVDLK